MELGKPNLEATVKLNHLQYSNSHTHQLSSNMSGRGKGKTAGKKAVSRSTKAGLQVCTASFPF